MYNYKWVVLNIMTRPFKTKSEKYIHIDCTISPKQWEFSQRNLLNNSRVLQRTLNEMMMDEKHSQLISENLSLSDFKKEFNRFEDTINSDASMQIDLDLKLQVQRIKTILTEINKISKKYIDYFEGKLETTEALLKDRASGVFDFSSLK
jgi:hypothetical protein